MATTLANCIYCGRFFNAAKGQGDHVLAARVFGEFEGDLRFRGQCCRCNNEFGCHEQVLAQSSEIGFCRQLAQPNLGKRANRGSLRQKGAHGSPQPKVVMFRENDEILVRACAENPLDGRPVHELIVRDTNGSEHHVPMFKSMRPARLQEAIRRRGLLSAKPTMVACAADMSDELERLVAQVFPSMKVNSRERLDPGIYPCRGRAEFEVSIAYWQALAKIAFHCYLVRNHRGLKGSEFAFLPIRNFIRRGGDPRSFFRPPEKPFISPFRRDGQGTVLCPQNWCHLLAANDRGTTISVYLQFFVGPGCVPHEKYVALGETDQGLAHGGVWGHLYQQEKNRTSPFAGTVSQVSVSPILPPIVP
jgi:hypothetical protein